MINDKRYIDRAEILREKGTNRKRFFRGEVDKYSWVDAGSSYLPSEILAAVLCAQLRAKDEIQSNRARIWRSYSILLRSWAGANQVVLPLFRKIARRPITCSTC